MGISTNRVLIKCHYRCNGKCVFCLFEDLKSTPSINAKFIVSQLNKIEQTYQIDDVTISGGEPALHPGFFSLLGAIKSRGYRKIRLATNAIAFSDSDLARRVKEYVDEVIISVHASNPEDYLEISELPLEIGKKLYEGIFNIRRYFNSVGTNTVVVKKNLRNLPQIAKFILELGVNWALLTYPVPLGRFKTEYVKLACPIDAKFRELATEYIQILSPHVECNYQTMPICLMKGLERFYQKEYDQFVIDFRTGKRNFFLSVDPEKNDADFTPMANKERCENCKYAKDCVGFWDCYREAGVYRDDA